VKVVEVMPGVVWHIPEEPPAPPDDTRKVGRTFALAAFRQRHGREPTQEELDRHQAELDWRRRRRLEASKPEPPF
jgi:hypothetical protein